MPHRISCAQGVLDRQAAISHIYCLSAGLREPVRALPAPGHATRQQLAPAGGYCEAEFRPERA
jgi:hypothetical protein